MESLPFLLKIFEEVHIATIIVDDVVWEMHENEDDSRQRNQWENHASDVRIIKIFVLSIF